MTRLPARVCVTGMGVVTPIGSDPAAFWKSLLDGRAGSAPVRSFDTSGMSLKVGCEAPAGPLPDRLRRCGLGGRTTDLALLAASQAVAAAGLEGRIEGDPRARIVVGTTMGDVHGFEQERMAHSVSDPDPGDLSLLTRRPMDVIGRSVAALYGLPAPPVTVPTACAAGAYAIGMAASLVARGEASVAIAVGAEAFSRLAFIGFARLGAMSPDVCRPFSRGRPGLLLGEGAAALVVEPEEEARARGADVAGFVEGFGLSCDAYHVTGPHPDGRGAARAMEEALRRARVAKDQVDYVNAHGTGTPLNDKVESLAIRSVFGARAADLPVSSIKALTGHMMGAAGAVEAVASLLSIRHGVIPPTWNWLERDPECDIDCVPNEPRERALRRVVSNSYAFGGNNASLVFSDPSSAA